MTPEQIYWATDFPRDDTRFIPIYSAPPVGSYSLHVVNPECVAVITHFWQGRTVPCLRDEFKCEACANKRSKRWKGYLGCFEPVHARLVLLELTIDAVRNCSFDVMHPAVPLRGLVVRSFRTSKSVRAPARIEFTSGKADLERLPQPFDIRAALCRAWNGSSRPADEAAG